MEIKLQFKIKINISGNAFITAISETFNIRNTVIRGEMNVKKDVRYMLWACEKEMLPRKVSEWCPPGRRNRDKMDVKYCVRYMVWACEKESFSKRVLEWCPAREKK